MESVQLEHKNVTELVLITLRDGVEEGRRFSNKEEDPICHDPTRPGITHVEVHVLQARLPRSGVTASSRGSYAIT